MENKVKKDLIIIFFIAILIYLPFIRRPVHIDDWVFLQGAEYFYKYRLDSLSKTIGFFGKKAPLYLVTHPPFLFLYLFFIKLINKNSNEVIFHLSFLPFFILAVLSFYFLVRKFFKNSSDKKIFFSTLLFMSMPIFILMSHTLMSDLPFCGLFLATLVFYIYGIEKESKFYLLLSSLFFSLTVLCSYQGLFLFFLLFVYNLINKKKVRFLLSVFLLPFISIILWLLYVFSISSKFHILSALWWGGNNFFDPVKFLDKIIGFLVNIGGVGIFFPFLIYLYWQRRRIYLYVFFLIIAGYLSLTRISEYSLGEKILFIFFFFAGTLATAEILLSLLFSKEKDEAISFLSLWYLSFLLSIILFLPQPSARYLLPLFPPLLIISLKNQKRIYSKTFFVTNLILGTLISLADYRDAQINKMVVDTLSKKFPKEKLYFTGEFGFRYYMEKKGYHYLFSNTEYIPAKEAIVVEPQTYLKGKISRFLKTNLRLLERLNFCNILPIVVMDKKKHTDIYSSSNGYGFLPFSFVGVRRTFKNFCVYKYKNPILLTFISNSNFQKTRCTFFKEVELVKAEINKKIITQKENLKITLFWRKKKMPFFSFLLLEGKYSFLFLPYKINLFNTKAGIIKEEINLPHLWRDFSPGKYTIYIGALPEKLFSRIKDKISFVKRKGVRIANIEILPAVYFQKESSFKKPKYLFSFEKIFPLRRTFVLSSDYSVSLPVKFSKSFSSLEIISFLAYASSIKQNETVAEVVVKDIKDKEYKFFLKAGKDTADWQIDIYGNYKHKKPSFYDRSIFCFSDYSRCGWSYRYITLLQFPRKMAVKKIKIRYTHSEGILVVDDLAFIE